MLADHQAFPAARNTPFNLPEPPALPGKWNATLLSAWNHQRCVPPDDLKRRQPEAETQRPETAIRPRTAWPAVPPVPDQAAVKKQYSRAPPTAKRQTNRHPRRRNAPLRRNLLDGHHSASKTWR
ncbi:hypothetical protein WJX72_002105 [[Myrmecia] bisecta]|uniref:Uncharacterized protein n=1 Tax=[Myrmecia] bisecta TaxID=41462 RepID=A0AAW1Q8B1_9CHLO